MYNEKIMNQIKEYTYNTVQSGFGGPFGAAITLNDGILCVVSNSVLYTKDPTAHAEVNAIREASKLLNTYDLSSCELYATGFPCPMCLGAIMWAGIKKIYVSGTLEDAEKIGFQDKFIYETIDKIQKMCYNIDVLDIEFHDRDIAQKLYQHYQLHNHVIY